MKYTAALTFLASVALAAPAPSAAKLPFSLPGALNNLIPKNPASPTASSCDLQNAQMPAAPTPLPAPAAGSVLSLVAIGKGTQNYTCADSSATTIPVAVGALATLYNASCIEASYPQFMVGLTELAYSVPSLQMIPAVGEHYFADSTTPTFDIYSWGTQHMAKNASSGPPTGNTTNVAWLRLSNKDTATKIVNVYRLETDHGVQPANCAGVTPGLFTVPYAAQYWFYTSS